MKELLESSGKRIAEILGAEAAYVTPGCCAALGLGVAACMAGSDPEKMERLPDTTGMKNEVLIQKGGRIKYDRCLTAVGARSVEVGDDSRTGPSQSERAHSRFFIPTKSPDGQPRTSSEQIEQAIGPSTAAIHYLAYTEGREGIVPLEEVVRIGKKHGVPVIVDAAGQVYPLDLMLRPIRIGADLVTYGAKYFWAPNSAGVLCGRRDLVESAALQGHIGWETTPYRTKGRALKVDRQEVMATVVALEEWFSMDHQARVRDYEKRARAIAEGLQGIPNVEATVAYRSGGGRIPNVMIRSAIPGKDAESLVNLLREGSPRIFVGVAEDSVIIGIPNLTEAEGTVVVQRVREIFSQ